jgi:hypothetical protein
MHAFVLRKTGIKEKKEGMKEEENNDGFNSFHKHGLAG